LLTVVGVVDRHEDLISLPDRFKVGGTFVYVPVTTSKKSSILVQVGKAPEVIPMPTTSNVEFKQILEPEAEARSSGESFHPLQAKPLIPGKNYSMVITAVDESGAWDCKEYSFNAKQRLVKISIKQIYVVNDSDPDSAGEAEFWVTVLEGGTATVGGSVVSMFHLGSDEYSVYNGRTIDVAWNVTIGPKEINPAIDAIVAVHTNGLEYDGIEGTEKAGSDGNDRVLNFPIGLDLEEDDFPDSVVRGDALHGDDFSYKVYFDWSVRYV
jgi:hypothetical protein